MIITYGCHHYCTNKAAAPDRQSQSGFGSGYGHPSQSALPGVPPPDGAAQPVGMRHANAASVDLDSPVRPAPYVPPPVIELPESSPAGILVVPPFVPAPGPVGPAAEDAGDAQPADVPAEGDPPADVPPDDGAAAPEVDAPDDPEPAAAAAPVEADSSMVNVD